MGNKRGELVIIFGIIIILFLIGIFINFVSSNSDKSKISKEVYEKLEGSEEVRVIVKLNIEEEKGFLFKTQKAEEEISLEKKEIKEEIISEIGKENVKHVFDEKISVEISEEKLNRLNKNPNIESVSVPKKIFAFLQDSVPMINASGVWPIQLSGVNITGIDETICIIDTGINFTHPDLIGKNKTCVINCVTENCVGNCSIGDDNGHGTHVAGIAAASGGINGVGKGVSLIGVKVLNSAGTGNGDDLEAGINWCIANFATYNISVISMSLGDCSNHSTYCNTDETADEVNNATVHNISVIAAAGNGPGGSCSGIINTAGPAAPACVQNATAVGAVNKNDVINYQRGALFELLAPGININSTWLSGYAIESGTSMAAPHVAGAFTLIRQFFRLQNNRVPTPSEIQSLLNNTGKRIDDSAGSGYNFTRIDIYSALISIDSSNPTVNLISPLNATTQFSRNVTFRCSANDVLLSNITLYVWNSSGIYNNTEIRQVSGVNGNLEVNLTNISYGNYNWNCLAYDHKANFSFASSNYSLTIGKIAVTLNSPANNLFTNQNQTYNCSAETETVKLLSNVTFYFWNSTSLIYNLTTNVSGTSNSTTFNYNFTYEGVYTWNCLAYNNISESSFAQSNYTITYDTTNPDITLISPSDGNSSTTTSYNFTFNASDTNNISNCTLILDGSIINSLDSVSKTSTNGMYNSSLVVGSHSWSINCTDVARNVGNSSFWSLIITSPPQQQIISSGGGGGTVITVKEYTPTIEQISQGYTQELNKNDKIKFTFFDEKATQHFLTVDYVGESLVNLTIQSSIVRLVLGLGQSAKLNLTSSDYYDFYIKLNSILNNKASLTIQTIHEEIPEPKITRQVAEEKEEKEKKETEKSEEEIEAEKERLRKEIIDKIKNLLIIILVIGVLVLLAERITKEKRKKLKKRKK